MLRIVAWLVVVTGLLGARVLEVEAAYRVTFQNGTSVEVQGYDDVGDAIRYPRYGGTITVPKAQVTAIEDVPPRLPSPAALPTPSSKPVSPALPGDANAPGLGAPVTRGGHTAPDAGVLPSRGVASRQEAPTSPGSGHANQAGRPLLSGPSFMNFLVPVLMALVIFWFGLQKAGFLGRGDDILPYEKNALLSPAERSFYGVLARAVADRYPIFAKVRLGDLLAVAAGTPQPWRHRSRIDRKHVDFVLCTSDGVTPILAIELDDASHARESRRARDAFVDRALTAAALPLLRIPAQVGYAPAELRDRIERTLAGRSQSHALDEITL